MEDFEKSAGGLDFDEESQSSKDIGSRLLEGGPDALLEQLDDLIPEKWREQITHFPLTALALGFGVGLYLGMKKGDEIIQAGSAMLSAAATANMSQILSDLGGGD